MVGARRGAGQWCERARVRMRGPGAVRAAAGRGAGLRRQYRRESPARRALRQPLYNLVCSALYKVSPWPTPDPPSAASSIRVSGPASARRLSFARFPLSVATNPLTRSLLFQMPGSTRRGCIPKVSGRREPSRNMARWRAANGPGALRARLARALRPGPDPLALHFHLCHAM